VQIEGDQDPSELLYMPILFKKLNHPKNIQYIDHCLNENNLVIVRKYIEGISLRELIKQKNKKYFSKNFLLKLFQLYIILIFLISFMVILN
jgi:serine/threonine protein kinase